MDAATALIEEAQRVASGADGRARDLQSELDDIEAKKLAVDAELKRAKGEVERLLNYQPCIGRDFQCPRCWVRDEIRSPLIPVTGTDPSQFDTLRCRACLADWLIPTR
jgi:hypothetical protein